MFSAVAHKNLAAAEGYFVEHLSQNDYYAAKEIRPGQWIGIGAERLGLNAGREVTRETLHGFIRTLPIPEAARQDLLALTPATYVGLAEELALRC